jgi:peptidase A4-like protein
LFRTFSQITNYALEGNNTVVIRTSNFKAGLCLTGAEWILEDSTVGEGFAPFASFEEVAVSETRFSVHSTLLLF